MENNISEIKHKLIKAGLCHKWQEKWKSDYSLEDIAGISLTFEGIEYMRKNKNTILELLPMFKSYINGAIVQIPYFGKGTMFINCTADLGAPLDVDVIYVSNSNIKITLPPYKVVKIISDSNSNIRINLLGNNIVFAELYDDSKMMLLKEGDDNTVNIIRNTNKCTVISYLTKKDTVRINTKEI